MSNAPLALLLAGAVAAFAPAPQVPPGHPPVAPQVPPGHPPLDRPPVRPAAPEQPAAPADRPAANPDDVATPQSTVRAYYQSVSGAAGAARDWDRFRSLFLPDARLVRAGDVPIVLAPEQFIDVNRVYFEHGGYFESPVHERIDSFGAIAQVFSTYESRRREADPAPYSRGINSFQLLRADGRWWIVSVLWDHERPDGDAIPPGYLPESGRER